MKAQPASNGASLNQVVREVVRQYLDDMGSTPPDNLHAFILGEIERPLIATVLEHVGGNQSRAARILGITRATLRNRIQRYDLSG
ncbi:helix-turn-helix domain-containing protein [Wenzhouxiangella marina]|uniref:Putative Fis-like DNA-binding protein n=1 Tax=Wenzhouxiangella marina TaxID=1579979 RepID=A0A0K0XSE9_9GAMM|nr:helix-turn-helix domain-containing protein [Wenzhouxiangella marina]AKS40551.1 Fis family transcriptional regulator [Wenzhouxiangella marina]MBB6088319.1 Fis family transcriptional regulator [Wenzhouxiangella marina]